MRVAVVSANSRRNRELTRMLAADPGTIVVSRESYDAMKPDEDEPEIVIWEPPPGEEPEWESEEIAGGGKIILLTDNRTGDAIGRALRSGMKAVLPVSISPEQLTAAVHAVAEDLTVFHGDDVPIPHRAFRTRGQAPVEPLTRRESETLAAMADGLTNRDIAARLGISEHTVKFHVATILSKLGAASRTEAVSLAIRNGTLMI